MLTKASMGRRIGAYLLDSLFIWIIILVAFLISVLFGILVSALISVLYYGISEGSKMHASLGKSLCGLMVVDMEGQPLSYGKAFVRSLCKILSSALLGIGYLIGLFDENGRTLHDRIAGTIVVANGSQNPVAVRQYPQPETPRANVPYQNIYPGRMPQGQAQVIGVSGYYAGRSFPVSSQGVMMGRDQTACDIMFPEGQAGQGISRVHCKIQYNPQTQMFILYDLGSSYGTFLTNGIRVTQGQPVALQPGETFYLANQAVKFKVEIR